MTLALYSHFDYMVIVLVNDAVCMLGEHSSSNLYTTLLRWVWELALGSFQLIFVAAIRNVSR